MDPPLKKRLSLTRGAHEGRDAAGEEASLARIDPLGERAFRARILTYLFAGGATLALVALLLLPVPPVANLAGTLATIAASYAAAGVTVMGYDRLPPWALNVLVALATALVSMGIYFAGTAPTDNEIFYLWVALYAFYFFTWAQAAFHLAFIGVAYGAVLLVLGADTGAERWAVTLGTLAAASILAKLLRERLEAVMSRLGEAASSDPLTGLPNRRGFEEAFEEELERARRSGGRLSLVWGDIDNFKQLNDRFGHQAGDEALQRVSELIERAKRRIDKPARVGGEEFALLLPDTDEEGARVVAERLREEMEHTFAGEPVELTFSFGVASFPGHGQTAEDLIGAADDAMYVAKDMGRNRCVVYSSEVPVVLEEPSTRRGRGGLDIRTLLVLAEALDRRKESEVEHARRVADYAELTARAMGLPRAAAERIRLAAVLHDVGKSAVPESVLDKPGPLTEADRAELRKHPVAGAHLLTAANLSELAGWVLAHHERPDGEGYPLGHSGDEIPLEARILAVAEAYDAMTSDGPHGTPMGAEEAGEELRRGAGTQFDRQVVDAFLASRRSRVS
ncbi:MAG: diguanylate cyclase [Actinomycetota bacterium]|nr:diguanylate cyclase [Actinomycetota bacterium]